MNLLLCKIQAQEMEFSIKNMIVIYIIIQERKQTFRRFGKNLQFQAILQNIRPSSLMHQAMPHPSCTKFGATGGRKKKPQTITKPKTFQRSAN